jgi:tRNA nucleotidyltransferase (CCA-adding enzyme)
VTAHLASDPASLLTRLKCSRKDVERGRAIGQWRDRYPDPNHIPQVRKWLSEVGDYADDLLTLPASSPSLARVVGAIRAARDPLAVKDLAVTGDDLLAAGVRPGPEVGEALQRMLDEVLADPTRNTREYLMSRV